MRILFAGGGTAGHINPALAIASEIEKRKEDLEVYYVGTPKGME
ncbi:MAG: glycosyltransferase, partial [Clostridia bacterium]|nr:glycosyltransferase [Clostridia bacterium]